MKRTLAAGAAVFLLLSAATAAEASAPPQTPGAQAAHALAQQLVAAAKAAEAADQGQGKSDAAVESDIEAAILTQIRDSAESPDVVAEALSLARRSGGLDSSIQVALSGALQIALGAVVPGPAAAGGRPGGPPPFGPGNGGGGGGGGSGYRGRN